MARTISKLIFAFLIIVLISIWAEIVKSPPDNSAHLYFLNVGQGDAELIQFKDFQILIDGGPDDSILSEIGSIMPISDREIDIVILTHPHADHIVGVNQILERYEVGEVYFNGMAYTSNQYLEFLSLLTEKGINAAVPEVNQSIGVFKEAKLEFLWPGKQFVNQNGCDDDKVSNPCVDNVNNTSEVVKFCYFDQCALFMGDLETHGQAAMFARNSMGDYSAKIIKIAHHGSSNGTNQALLDMVKPSYAVIEVGAGNTYGHPSISVLNLLEKYFADFSDGGISKEATDTKILRTDRDGNIEFKLNQTSIEKK